MEKDSFYSFMNNSDSFEVLYPEKLNLYRPYVIKGRNKLSMSEQNSNILLLNNRFENLNYGQQVYALKKSH